MVVSMPYRPISLPSESGIAETYWVRISAAAVAAVGKTPRHPGIPGVHRDVAPTERRHDEGTPDRPR